MVCMYSGFSLSPKTNISKFQFDLDYCQALSHEPLARVIAQALPVFDINLHLHLHFYRGWVVLHSFSLRDNQNKTYSSI